MSALTKREQARYRAIMRRLAQLSSNGWDRASHPDFEPLEIELEMLARKLTEPEKCHAR